ncbi:dihydroneopterin aldolase [Pantanalinema sp. GBBB05]|uniref:dihydroneopterin aldolase n=1 Tax=Pantanalinema sp. GBBB05 TaxID=2604139 RepID=UPI001D8633E2|nr:dihydroneopterin aldolase [Pantanalinema sp. GBBB05]
MDCIHLTGIRSYGYIGALPEEQVLGQWFEVDLILWLDLSLAGQSDQLQDTFDYRSAIATVQQLINTAQFALLERLASAIANAILFPSPPADSGLVQQVQVRLTKLAAPIPNFGGKVTVEIQRSRSTERGSQVTGSLQALS